jgi:predicted HNH restriction endonuclease
MRNKLGQFKKGCKWTSEVREKILQIRKRKGIILPSRKGIKWSEKWKRENGKKIRNFYLRKGYKSRTGCRAYILERDNYICQVCKFREPDIMDVDHIKPVSLFPELQYDLDNLTTLCPNCHRRKTLEDQREVLRIRGHWKKNKLKVER